MKLVVPFPNLSVIAAYHGPGAVLESGNPREDVERRHLGRMAPEEEPAQADRYSCVDRPQAERLEERGERDVEVGERLRVERGAELDAAGGVDDLDRGLARSPRRRRAAPARTR